jgi:DNA-directed RNA polymerase specialized sigma24 family protein
MHTLKQGLEELELMTKISVELEALWQDRLLEDFPDTKPQTRSSIVCWLLGEDRERFEAMPPAQLNIIKQAMEYRYRILGQRYLNVSATKAYHHLIKRLSSIMMVRNKIRTWVSLSRDRHRAVTDVLQEVLQEMLNSDRYIQTSISAIARCTTDENLRNALLMTTIEEYCLRPVRNQPLLVYRFVNFLRRAQRGGMTQVPQNNNIRIISEEMGLDEGDDRVNLHDREALARYQEDEAWEEQQMLRLEVQREFERYLENKIGPVAARWLRLYVRGYSQEAIAQKLKLDIKQVYRLREKVSYHALKGFALKSSPLLVANWLKTTLDEHNFGLTPSQWETLLTKLTPEQRRLLECLKAGQSLEEAAKTLNWKSSKVMSEWTKIYEIAQSLR